LGRSLVEKIIGEKEREAIRAFLYLTFFILQLMDQSVKVLHKNRKLIKYHNINLFILLKFCYSADFYVFYIHFTPSTYVSELFKGFIKTAEVLPIPELWVNLLSIIFNGSSW